jgi:hypothetical protein
VELTTDFTDTKKLETDMKRIMDGLASLLEFNNQEANQAIVKVGCFVVKCFLNVFSIGGRP